MHILVVNVAASEGGALSILNDMIDHLKENSYGHQWTFWVSTSDKKSTKDIDIITYKEPKKNWIKRLWWERVTAPKEIIRQKPDVVLSLQNIIIPVKNVPQIVYIHQAIPFQNIKRFSFFRKEERILAIYQYIIGYLIKKSAQKARAVIVQTNWMKRSLESKIANTKGKIFVVPPTISFYNMKKDTIINNKDKGYFFPANAAIYKNHLLIMKAAKILKDRGYTPSILFTINEEERPDLVKYKAKYSLDNVVFGGKISRKETFNNYYRYTLVFPSYIETFGLPLLEARMCNSKIIASSCEFSKEVLDGYKLACFFSPFSAEELADKMEKDIKGSVNFEIEDKKSLFNKEIMVQDMKSTWYNIVKVIESQKN